MTLVRVGLENAAIESLIPAAILQCRELVALLSEIRRMVVGRDEGSARMSDHFAFLATGERSLSSPQLLSGRMCAVGLVVAAVLCETVTLVIECQGSLT